jgi:hypothetical protein
MVHPVASDFGQPRYRIQMFILRNECLVGRYLGSPVRCSLYRMARRLARPSSLASRRSRSISGRSRRSSPSCSIRSKEKFAC